MKANLFILSVLFFAVASSAINEKLFEAARQGHDDEVRRLFRNDPLASLSDKDSAGVSLEDHLLKANKRALWWELKWSTLGDFSLLPKDVRFLIWNIVPVLELGRLAQVSKVVASDVMLSAAWRMAANKLGIVIPGADAKLLKNSVREQPIITRLKDTFGQHGLPSNLIHLEGTNLSGITLTWHPQLEEDDLILADPEREGELVGVNFAHASLRSVNFSGSDLRNANFEGADLRGCNFKNANLRGANLKGAKLEGAIFEGARLQRTLLAPAN